MKISTKGRYGIRALIDLAVNSTNGHVSLVNIANRNQISVHYLEHVFSSLKRGGIVKSVKGAQGGYVLADKPENITVAQMILALDTLLWDRVNEETKRILESITLADLVNEFVREYETEQNMYYI
mgnify:CR=1 FL=1